MDLCPANGLSLQHFGRLLHSICNMHGIERGRVQVQATKNTHVHVLFWLSKCFGDRRTCTSGCFFKKSAKYTSNGDSALMPFGVVVGMLVLLVTFSGAMTLVMSILSSFAFSTSAKGKKKNIFRSFGIEKEKIFALLKLPFTPSLARLFRVPCSQGWL